GEGPAELQDVFGLADGHGDGDGRLVEAELRPVLLGEAGGGGARPGAREQGGQPAGPGPPGGAGSRAGPHWLRGRPGSGGAGSAAVIHLDAARPVGPILKEGLPHLLLEDFRGPARGAGLEEGEGEPAQAHDEDQDNEDEGRLEVHGEFLGIVYRMARRISTTT